MKKVIHLTPPLTEEQARQLRMGDEVMITGTIYTGRDEAHKRLRESIERGEKLSLDFHGEILYYVGPSPTKPGRAIGSAGPTTSCRMDVYTPVLIRETGLRGMIGKGDRSREVIEAMKKEGTVYFVAIGGAAALLAKAVKRVETVLYPELGPEAVRRLYVKDFPVIVAIDSEGRDIFKEGPLKYRK